MNLKALRQFSLALGVFFCSANISYTYTTSILKSESFQTSIQVEEQVAGPAILQLWKESQQALRGSVSSSKSRQLSGTASSHYAYAFLLAGCDPDRPSYRGFLYNILISFYTLRDKNGSEADLVLMVRMSPNTPYQRLPAVEEQWLRQLGARVQYLDKPPPASGIAPAESFDAAQMLKFHILDLIDYRRVLYLDADVMPVCNLDYIFELSDGQSAILKENLVVAWTKEPSNGGFFMLRPGRGERQALEQIVRETRRSAFDPVKGWGHEIASGEEYRLLEGTTGRKWDFYAAESDQGLLYHWVKFVKQKVTIVTQANRVEHWDIDQANNALHLEHVMTKSPFVDHTCIPADWKQAGFAFHPTYEGAFLRQHPYSDYIHFYGKHKPWEGPEFKGIISDKHEAWTARNYWFHVLRELNVKLDMGIDFQRWDAFVASCKKWGRLKYDPYH